MAVVVMSVVDQVGWTAAVVDVGQHAKDEDLSLFWGPLCSKSMSSAPKDGWY